ncbi:ComF family protein [Paenibacillus sp. 1P03SA]|uniref:ComF family protein n=1 Tax=Paenibacillus sp. 1P03SA TaxID=3132294 RepID=UPI0039A354CF
MFVEVNDLKALIIDLGDNNDTDMLEMCKAISYKIPCCFLVNREELIIDLELEVNPESIVMVKKRFHHGVYEKNIIPALQELQVQPYEVAFVSQSFFTLKNVLYEPIGTILIQSQILTQQQIGFLPDFIIRYPSELEDIIDKNNTGFFAEINSLFPHESTSRMIINSQNSEGLNVYALGRYFSPQHHKSPSHILTQRILKSKTDPKQVAIFAKIIFPFIKDLKPDALVAVPPQPGENNRFSTLVSSVCQEAEVENLTSAFSCIENYPKQKTQKKGHNRTENVKGKFRATSDVKDKHIFLFDDLLTTGSTLFECAQTLLNAGAKEVSILVLAVNQFPGDFTERPQFLCQNNCGGSMKIFIRKDNDVPFWGCINFAKCKKPTYHFKQGCRKKNELNQLVTDVEEEEEEDWF